VVFVSICFSGVAGNAFVAAGIPHVVAVRSDSKVTDKSAIQFAEVFYAHLLAGETVRKAFGTADAEVRASRGNGAGGGVGSSEFLLLPECKPGCKDPHDKTVFDSGAHDEDAVAGQER